MQGILCMPQNLQTGSPPPAKTIASNDIMNMTTEQRLPTKETSNQSTRSDSGIFSATGNSTFREETVDISNRTQHSESGDTDNRSDCSSPDRKYLCPICEKMMTSQHDFTLHIRSHNNNGTEDPEKGFTCQICFKVLSSSSSLDRHVLVHSGERPFTCKYCGDTFTTNGNMHRHMRTHVAKNDNYESDGSSDSNTSTSSKTVEFNNNKIVTKADIYDNGKKRKLETIEESGGKRFKIKDREYKTKDLKDVDYKEREFKDQEFKDGEYKGRDYKERDHKERGLKDRDYKERDHQERDHQKRDHQERDHQERHLQEKDHQERDHQERGHQERDYKERDYKERDYKERDYKERDYQDGEFNNRGSNNRECNNKEFKDQEFKYREYADRQYKDRSFKETSDEDSESYSIKCPVCERDDFASVTVLEMHLQDNHPDYPSKCHHCNQTFKNNKLLNFHRLTCHSDENGKKNYIVGFKELTYMDFSSEKFPQIARVECERNFHKTSGSLKFVCPKCSRAFPCANSLDSHKQDCCTGLDLSVGSEGSIDLSRPGNISESDLRRADFFARLDLQNRSPDRNQTVPQIPDSLPSPTKLQQRLLLEKAIKTIDNSKDLADIQSIISMTTNGSILQQLQGKANELPNIANHINNHENSKGEEEESQDLFTAEFRKMKLRGEFPCRLCTAVFPNLRALKGHNRAHLNGNNNGTYRCNMCPHSSIDKAALIRHMRTHNGDRPYECSLCNYAFTTKANCERHLRNRHAKTTREEVKKAIIYHPSEDPTNDEINKQSGKDDMKKFNNSIHSDTSDLTPEKIRSSTPKYADSLAPLPKIPEDNHADFNLLPITSKLKALQEQAKNYPNVNEIICNENLKSLKELRLAKSEHLSPYLPSAHFTPNFTNTSTPHSKIHVKSLDLLKQPPSEYDNNSDDEDYHSEPKYHQEDQPMDLVLDLSKKKTEPKTENTPKNLNVPEDLSKKYTDIPTTIPNEILQQQLLKNPPKFDPSLYASQLAMAYNTFPGLTALPNWPAFPLNPLIFQTMQNRLLQQDPQEIKERIQRLQLCGGGMIMDNFAEQLKNIHQQSMSNSSMSPFANLKMNEIKQEIKYPESKYPIAPMKSEDMKPLSLNIEPNYPDSLSKLQSPLPQHKPDLIQSPNSVKMVIKNGVLMPKQKQRRYRTERPFSCEHCSARFTLRSNMERHIKQQHPQYWSQRQRSNIGTPGRKSQSLPGNVKGLCELTIPNFDVPKINDYEETKDQISDKIKYAILAQHLRSAQTLQESKKEEDDDCALVIDEKDEGRNETKTEDLESSISNLSKDGSSFESICKTRILEEKLKQLHAKQIYDKLKNEFAAPKAQAKPSEEAAQDLVPVSRLLVNASQQQFKEYFHRENEDHEAGAVSEEDEEGLVASGSTSEGNNSGTDENKSESEAPNTQSTIKKKSAYSLAPNRVSCPYCSRKFPWTSSLRRHILTHTGQKPFKCSHCPLLFTTKSNCDRHLLRKHGNAATTISNDASANNSNYLMRNVPERPFKCSSCPSSTFSTYSNLKKHMSCKHGAQGDELQARGYEAGSSEDEKFIHNDQKSEWDNQIAQSKAAQNCETQNPQLQNSDLPFKCHLCEGSFGDRQDALDHIRDKHSSEYELLMSKNALDNSSSTPDESNHNEDEEHDIRGKFPDYSNRKVICAFCMRRFWSAEDLRRHMRTHTGERPFSCDICRRRFTLKHSMLRHRKKHNIGMENDNGNSDEDLNHMNPAFEKIISSENNNATSKHEKTDESDGNEGGSDLISNLLGIRDRSIIDQVLTASADDAAKLLGVKNGKE